MTKRTPEEIAAGLTEAQRAELADIYRRLNYSGHVFVNPLNPLVAAALSRKGLLRQYEQSENPIHEPLRKWKVYGPTHLGRTVATLIEKDSRRGG